MLKITFVVIFASLVICNASRYVADFDQIVLNQSHPITKFWSIHNAWPYIDYNSLNPRLSTGAWESLQTPSIWILNSFFPARSDGYHPEYCYNQPPSYEKIVIDSKHKTRLRERWPNYISVESEETFWEDAWLQHGLCMSHLSEISTPNKYFSKALTMFQQYNIGTFLENNGISSGVVSSVKEIAKIIKADLDIDIQLMCIVDEDSPTLEQYLSGAYVCLSKSYQLQNCITKFPTTCNRKKNVFIPSV